MLSENFTNQKFETWLTHAQFLQMAKFGGRLGDLMISGYTHIFYS